MNANVKRALRISLMSLPLVVLLVLAGFRKLNPHSGTSAEFDRWGEEDTAAWAKRAYVSLDDREKIKVELSRLRIEGLPLSPEMGNAYWESLLDFFFAYHDGNIESWKRFRFGGDLPRKLTTNGIFQVKFYYGLARRPVPAAPDYAPKDESFLAKWEARVRTNSPPEVSTDKDLENLFFKFLEEITYGQLYSNYFEGICLDEMIVKHDHYTSHPPKLSKYPFFPFRVQRGRAVDATFPNQGYDYWNNEDEACAFFVVHPTLTDLLSDNGRIDCINTFVYIKIQEKGTVTPILIRHVWNPNTQRWMVAEMVDANLMHKRVMAVMF